MKRICSITVMVLLVAASLGAAETRVGPRGQIIVDGTPSIPLGVWVQPTYLFDYNSQLGLTCMVNPHVERGMVHPRKRTIFSEAERTGLKVITRCRDSVLKEPSVLAWSADVMVPGRVDRLRRSYDWIRSKDRTHFILRNISVHQFLGDGSADFYREGLRCTDAVICHVWPEFRKGGERNLRNVATFVDMIRDYCKDRPGGEVAIMPDINPHAWNRRARSGGEEFPAPTRAELRFQIWLALIHGADAICFFPISFDPFVFSQITAQNEQEISWNAALVRRMTPALTADESPLEIAVRSDRDDGIIDVTTRQADGTHTVFLVNGQAEEQTATLSVPGLGSRWTLRDAVNDKPLDLKGSGTYSEKLPGLALRIWQLVPAKVVPTDEVKRPASNP